VTNAARELLPDKYAHFLAIFNEQQVERNNALAQGVDPLTEIGPPPLRIARERWRWEFGERNWLIVLKDHAPSLMRRPRTVERLTGSGTLIYRKLALHEINRIFVTTTVT
jgi:hypothetical protein